mgnify:CR=1 FL=1
MAFGPVPSRRLGRSLGINNIPAKVCSYSCVYCQLGRTTRISIEREEFYEPERILDEVRWKLKETELRGEKVDYLTFVPDGEPTLDVNLGREIGLLNRMGIPIAILTNGSLLQLDDVRRDLIEADLVSLKVDAVSRELWRRVNRPHRDLVIDNVLEGMVKFSRAFRGRLITETMLIDGVNYKGELEAIADFLSELKPYKAYIAIPTRPPAERWVKPADEGLVNEAFHIFSERLGYEAVEYLIGYEGNAFSSSGDAEEDILSITAVHPMREEGVRELLRRAKADWGVVERLLDEGRLIELEYEGCRYYMRKIPSRPR